MSLNIWSDEEASPGTWVKLLPTSHRYQATMSCVNLALAMLESPVGRSSLVGVAAMLLDQMDRQNKPHLFTMDRKELAKKVDLFLQKVRATFPNLYISVDEQGEASTFRFTWGSVLERYDPVAGARMQIHRVIIDNMIATRNTNDGAFDVFKFQMSLAIAHEIVHLLTGFLTGQGGTMTPPDVALRGFGEKDMGEAGRYWEGRYLGGIVEFWGDNKHPLGNRQSGEPYLFPDGHPNSVGKLVDRNWMGRMLRREFSFPIITAPGAAPLTRSMLRRAQKLETSDLRSKRRKRVPVSTPPPGASSNNIAYRRLPAENGAGSNRRHPAENSSSAYRRAPVAANDVVYRQVPVEVAPVAYRRPPADHRGYQYGNMAPGPHSGYGPDAYYPRR